MTLDAVARRLKDLASIAARAADDKKGEDILLLHVSPVCSIAEYMLIVSAGSPAQLEAIQEKVEVDLEDEGERPIRRDGRSSDVWRVLDYGGLLIHLMHPIAREFYSLEKLYHGARKVSWDRP